MFITKYEIAALIFQWLKDEKLMKTCEIFSKEILQVSRIKFNHNGKIRSLTNILDEYLTWKEQTKKNRAFISHYASIGSESSRGENVVERTLENLTQLLDDYVSARSLANDNMNFQADRKKTMSNDNVQKETIKKGFSPVKDTNWNQKNQRPFMSNHDNDNYNNNNNNNRPKAQISLVSPDIKMTKPPQAQKPLMQFTSAGKKINELTFRNPHQEPTRAPIVHDESANQSYEPGLPLPNVQSFESLDSNSVTEDSHSFLDPPPSTKSRRKNPKPQRRTEVFSSPITSPNSRRVQMTELGATPGFGIPSDGPVMQNIANRISESIGDVNNPLQLTDDLVDDVWSMMLEEIGGSSTPSGYVPQEQTELSTPSWDRAQLEPQDTLHENNNNNNTVKRRLSYSENQDAEWGDESKKMRKEQELDNSQIEDFLSEVHNNSQSENGQ